MRNKIIIIVMACFSWIAGQAQENKFDFGISLFPNYSIGIVSIEGENPTNAEAGFQPMENWKPSISAHIFVEYKLNEKSILGAGIGYQNNGTRTKKTELNYGIDPISREPISDPTLPGHARFVYNHHNVEIPIYYRHKFGNRFFILVGTSGIINISNSTTTIRYFSENDTEKDTRSDESTEFRKFNITGNFGFGIDYLKTEKMSFFVLPYAQYGFLGISENAKVNRNLLSVGISTGIRM
jgi:hypothetical protein